MNREQYDESSQALVLATRGMLEAVCGLSADEKEAAETAARAFEALCAHGFLRGVSHAEDHDPMAELLHDGCDQPAPDWQKCLVHGTTKLAGGWTRCGGRSLYVTGRKVDSEIVVYVTTYLIREIQRLTLTRYGGQRRLREAFGFGAMQTVLETLRAAREHWDGEHPSMAEVDCGEGGALQAYWKRSHGQAPSESQVDVSGYDSTACRAGRAAGYGLGQKLRRGPR